MYLGSRIWGYLKWRVWHHSNHGYLFRGPEGQDSDSKFSFWWEVDVPRTKHIWYVSKRHVTKSGSKGDSKNEWMFHSEGVSNNKKGNQWKPTYLFMRNLKDFCSSCSIFESNWSEDQRHQCSHFEESAGDLRVSQDSLAQHVAAVNFCEDVSLEQSKSQIFAWHQFIIVPDIIYICTTDGGIHRSSTRLISCRPCDHHPPALSQI